MSRGYGAVQRKVLALIEAQPDGALTTGELCRFVYPTYHVSKAQRVAVGRALRRMKLPEAGIDGDMAAFVGGALHDLWEAKLLPEKPERKCAFCEGEALGR